MIVTPLLYPGGGRVVLRIEEGPDGYIVTDYGAGKREADLMGGQHIFNAIARKTAERFAVRFDSFMIFELEVPREALVTASIAVANASKCAVEMTADALSERRANDQRMILWEVLREAFPAPSIRRHEKFVGHSDTWEFDAIIQNGPRPVLFQVVTPFANAVNAAVVKFLDVKDLGAEKTTRIAVPTVLDKTPHLHLLGRTARIIALDSPAESFRLAA